MVGKIHPCRRDDCICKSRSEPIAPPNLGIKVVYVASRLVIIAGCYFGIGVAARLFDGGISFLRDPQIQIEQKIICATVTGVFMNILYHQLSEAIEKRV